MTTKNPKQQKLEDKVDFKEPNQSNVQVGDFVLTLYNQTGLDYERGDEWVKRIYLSEIIGVSRRSILAKTGLDIYGKPKEGDARIEEYSFSQAIVLKRNGTYLVGRNVNVLGEVRP